MINLSQKQIEEIVRDIAGSTTSIEDGIAAAGYGFDENSVNALDEIDSRVFVCERCGWTCWRDEESQKESVCDDCYEDEEDED